VLHHLPYACLIGNDTLRPSGKSISLKPNPDEPKPNRKKLFVSGFNESLGSKTKGLNPGDSANPDTTIKSLACGRAGFAFLHRFNFKVTNEFFLVEKYDISYLPSAAMLGRQRRQAENSPASRNATWLVLAPFPDRFQGTRKEAETIVSKLDGSRRGLIGTEATEAGFKTKAEKFDLIHFASHSHLAINTPESTYVELQPEASEDGRLTVAEILPLKLGANFIVLSSCESGMGTSRFYNPRNPNHYHPNDEFIGLARAFLVAGAKQVLSTLWPVHDRASAEFMAQFYTNLTAFPPAMALAATQRHFIAKNFTDDFPFAMPFSHPYIWGAYLVVGVP
jgi:CHAT domain-containing protein